MSHSISDLSCVPLKSADWGRTLESLEEEPWRKKPRGGSLEEESWGRNPGGVILEEESWRSPGGGILEEES
jgi:hypothetical protein